MIDKELWEPVAIVGELCEQTRKEVIANGVAIGAYLYTSAPTMLTEQAPCDIPEGWKLVPIEPTPEMLNAARLNHMAANAVYKAMLSAAPEYKGVEE